MPGSEKPPLPETSDIGFSRRMEDRTERHLRAVRRKQAVSPNESQGAGHQAFVAPKEISGAGSAILVSAPLAKQESVSREFSRAIQLIRPR
jgi:hypothetical protein